MKNLFTSSVKVITTLVLALGLTTSAFGAQKVETGTSSDLRIAGDNAYAQICMAALDSRKAVNKKARELGISRQKRDKIVCNDMSLTEFAATYEADQYQTIATVE